MYCFTRRPCKQGHYCQRAAFGCKASFICVYGAFTTSTSNQSTHLARASTDFTAHNSRGCCQPAGPLTIFLSQTNFVDIFMFWEQEGWILDLRERYTHLVKTLWVVSQEILVATIRLWADQCWRFNSEENANKDHNNQVKSSGLQRRNKL